MNTHSPSPVFTAGPVVLGPARRPRPVQLSVLVPAAHAPAPGRTLTYTTPDGWHAGLPPRTFWKVLGHDPRPGGTVSLRLRRVR